VSQGALVFASVSFCWLAIGDARSEVVTAAGRIIDVNESIQPTTYPLPIQGFYGQKVFVATDYILNTNTHTVITYGDWVVQTAPQDGAISSSIVAVGGTICVNLGWLGRRSRYNLSSMVWNSESDTFLP
jgi:hypothetical protein